MDRTVKSASSLLSAALALASLPASALQTLDVSDGVSVEAVLSMQEPTRIRIDGAAITNVFGNIYSSNCGASPSTGGAASPAPAPAPSPVPTQPNPAGEVVLECDADKGEIYIRPVGTGLKPVNLFISSQQATYTLLLRRSDVPADTIVLRDRSLRQARLLDSTKAGPAGQAPAHIRSLKAMLVAMSSDRVPADIRVDEVNRPVRLWQEARFALTRTYEGRGLVGERYQLTNVSNDNLVLAEQEFDRETGDVLAVAVENHNLRPGDSTAVFIIRRGGE